MTRAARIWWPSASRLRVPLASVYIVTV